MARRDGRALGQRILLGYAWRGTFILSRYVLKVPLDIRPCLDQPLNQAAGMTGQEASALWTLRETWGRYYRISVMSGAWRADRFGTETRQLTASTSGELAGIIWQDFITWEKEVPQ